VSIHYGDSDDDILAAKEAGIRGIRLMRAANSTYQPGPTLGGYGEEVLINSNY
jgi:class B acid phosphatase